MALIGNRKLAPLINSHLTMDSSIILSTQGADWKSETGPLNLDHIAKILDIVVLNTVSDQQTILRGVVADVDCFKFQSQFCKAQDFLALLDALCNWSYITQLFSKSEQSSHLRRMIVDIVITELLRCMILISCVSEGKEPFVRSKNFNVYIMDEAVSITFSHPYGPLLAEWRHKSLDRLFLPELPPRLSHGTDSLACISCSYRLG
ncbi:hypothetical protein LINPERPRIM_LOCUS42565 [Linum perenne]